MGSSKSPATRYVDLQEHLEQKANRTELVEAGFIFNDDHKWMAKRWYRQDPVLRAPVPDGPYEIPQRDSYIEAMLIQSR